MTYGSNASCQYMKTTYVYNYIVLIDHKYYNIPVIIHKNATANEKKMIYIKKNKKLQNKYTPN